LRYFAPTFAFLCDTDFFNAKGAMAFAKNAKKNLCYQYFFRLQICILASVVRKINFSRGLISLSEENLFIIKITFNSFINFGEFFTYEN